MRAAIHPVSTWWSDVNYEGASGGCLSDPAVGAVWYKYTHPDGQCGWPGLDDRCWTRHGKVVPDLIFPGGTLCRMLQPELRHHFVASDSLRCYIETTGNIQQHSPRIERLGQNDDTSSRGRATTHRWRWRWTRSNTPPAEYSDLCNLHVWV